MIHTVLPTSSSQFRPEAKGGLMDIAFLLDMYLGIV